MEIVDVTGKKLKACCSFIYGDYIISASTIFKPNSIVVFDKETKQEEYIADSVEDAIDYLKNNY